MENKIKGTRDYYGIEGKKIQYVFSKLREVSSLYNFEEVITPTFENTDLFKRTVGEGSDVVNKEMYTFTDKGDRSITLKPEGTASIARMVIENKLIDNNQKQSLFYITQMFRYERPQKGRQREFFQYGVERFGENNAFEDAEIITLAIRVLNELNINKYELRINTIGSLDTRARYNQELNSFLKDNLDKLSESSVEKFNSGNILRILDSKSEQDIELISNSPKIIDFLTDEEKERFESVKQILDQLNINYILDNNLVRGLDYYNDLVFEFVSTDIERLGSKSTLIGGGRYNNLINQLDNSKDAPAIGFAAGIERLMLASEEYLDQVINNEKEYCVLPVSEEYTKDALLIATKMRENNKEVFVDLSDRRFTKKLERADKQEYKYIVIIGKELEQGQVVVKDMSSSEQTLRKVEEI